MERVGLIDLGSNTARLVIFDVLEGGYFVVVNELRESVRLGELEKDGALKQARMLQAVKTINMFRKICTIDKVDKIFAVATAAVRQAKNQKLFLGEVYNNTGIKLRVLSELEEATYVYQGVINSMEVPKAIIMEIGGGSTKFVYYNRRNILQQTILPFGAVTLTEMFAGEDISNKETCDRVCEFFRSKLAELDWLKEVEPDTQLIGVGGSFRNLSKISRKMRKYPLDMVHNYLMSKTDLDSIHSTIQSLELDKTKKIKGLSSVRADVFPSAITAIKTFVEYMGFETFYTSGCGLREGIIFNYAVPSTCEKPITDVLGHGLNTYIAFFGENQQHCEQAFNLSIQLFKQLRVLHKFPRSYIRVLRVASMLHDIGKKFKFYNNQKHASYMILNSNLYGLSHKDIILAAFITDVYNKEEINFSDWNKYNTLISEEDIEAVRKLAVILRLAISFDFTKSNAITEINCDVLGDSVILKTEINGDASLELKEANAAGPEFRKVFKKNLEIL